MSAKFPDTMDFSGFNAPSHVECDIYDLIVEGEIPAEINGTWYRLTPDHQFSPRYADDTYLSGDGMISSFTFANSHVGFKSRYILSERLRNDRAARRSLYGAYRNPFTDDPSVAGKSRGVYNTTPIWHGGKLLALKEDNRPMELHPRTLETMGEWDFDGRLRSQTMTAHTRLDNDTGELYFYGYEADGLATNAIAFCVADRNGELIREEWFEAPYVSLMHDFLVTREHVLFPVFPMTTSMEHLQKGGPHWYWDPDKTSFVGIMPRDGSVKDIRWFTGPKCSSFHFMNAFTEGNRVHMDFGYSSIVPFPFIQKASGLNVKPQDARSHYARWTFDLSKPEDKYEETIIAPPGDMPRIADKDHMRDYDIGYYQRFDPANGPPLIAGPVGAGFNTISRLEIKTGKMTDFCLNDKTTVQEHIHIPSKQPGHEGYLAFVADLHDQFLSDVILLEAEHIDKGPIARIKIPYRLRVQVHGNWVPAETF